MNDATELGVGDRSFARLMAAVLVLGGCTPGVDQPEEAAKLTQEIYDGASDTGDDVREVVQILVPVGGGSGMGSGVLIAPDVVITAAHVLDPFVRQCGYQSIEDYTYAQSASIGGSPASNTIRVLVGHAGNEDLTDLQNTSVIEVIGIQTHERYLQRVATDCCGGSPGSCTACGGTQQSPATKMHAYHDLALLKLAQPITSDPNLSGISFPQIVTQLANGFGVATLENEDVAIAGTGLSDATPSATGIRALGVSAVTTLDTALDLDTCDSSGSVDTLDSSCDGCMLVLETGSCGTPGDSGGPVYANDTGIGASDLGLGSYSGRLLVGIGSFGVNVSQGGGACNGSWKGHYPSTWDQFYQVDGLSYDPLADRGSWITARLADFDGDGIPDATDNCVVAFNPGQDNCNRLAESKWLYPERGDACDPIPCGESQPDKVQNVVSTGSGTICKSKTGRIIRENMDILPHVSTEFGDRSNLGDIQATDPESDVYTSYHFCHDEPGQLVCSQFVDDQYEGDEPGQFSQNHPFQRVTMSTGGMSTWWNEDLDYDHDGVSGSSVTRTWEYWTDYGAWDNANYFIISAPGDCPSGFGCGTNLSGRFWVHSDTGRGTLSAGTAAGYRVSNNIDAADDDQLSNHYIDLAPDAKFDWVWCAYVWNALPQAFRWWPIPWEKLPPVFDGVEGHAAQLFVLEDVSQKRIALVQEGGGSVDAGGFIEDELTELLVYGQYQWVSAVEPSLAMTPAMTYGGPMALALDGNDVADAVWQHHGRLGSSDDYDAVSIGALAGAPGHDDPVAVYSRAAQRLFLVGGMGGSGPSGEIWMRPVATGQSESWQEISLQGGYAPEEVLAATYSARDRRLWILDIDDARHIRLARVHPATGHTRVMKTWERSTGWNRHWLGVDQDGWVLLFTANTSARKHAVARLSISHEPPDGELVVEAFEERSRALYYQPVIDMKGYTFVMGPAPGGSTDLVERRTDVPGSPADASDLDDVL